MTFTAAIIGSIITGLLMLLGMLFSYRSGKLTLPATFVAGLVGFAVFAGGGFTGFLLLAGFFALGVLATRHQRALKAIITRSVVHAGQRHAGQVLANGGVAAMLGVIAIVDVDRKELYLLMMAASLSAAAADTISSELGMVYGRRFFNILSLRRDQRGLDGVVSLEGTLLGIGASAVMGSIYCLFEGWDRAFLVIVITGTSGNLLDSVLGASLERTRFIRNDAVNFLNTLAAALLVLLF